MDLDVQTEQRGIVPSLWPIDYVTVFVKDPQDVLDYYVDFSKRLAANETLSSVSVSATAGLTVGTSWIDGSRGYVWLSGGTLAGSYTVKVTGVTNLSQTLAGEFLLKVEYR